MNPIIHILHIEDIPADAERVQSRLEEAGLVCRITCVQTCAEFDTALRQDKLDVILAGYRLPTCDGMYALRLAQELRPEVPFIFVSGTMGEEAAIEALTQGATDYVLKPNMVRLESAVKRALQEAQSRREHKMGVKALADSEAKMHSILENIGIGVALISPGMEILELNKRMRQWFPGIDTTLHPFCYRAFNNPPRNEVCAYCPTLKTLKDGHIYEGMTQMSQDGEIRNYRIISSPVLNATGEIVAAVEMVEDITERKQAEEALQHSNDMLRAIIEAAPTAIIGLDLDGHVHSVWNPAAEKMLGWSAEEAMGRPLPSVPVDSQEEFKRFRERIRSGMTLDGVEVRRQRRDGTPIDYSIYASPLHDVEGHICGNIAVLVDITERKRAETALKVSEARYIDLYENSPDMYVSVNAQTASIEQCNQTLAKALGRPKEEIIGRKVFELYHPDCLDLAKEAFKEFREKGEIHDRELQLRKKDGSKLDVSLSVSAVRAEDGTILFSRSTLRDITERLRNRKINAARIHLMQFAVTHSLDELLEETVNEAEKLTESQVGFYHFVDEDQQSLTLQEWSTRTKTQFCKAQGKGLHYSIADAGVWVDCVHQRKPVVHNDYMSLTHRKGLPEGHAEVIRELVVPVFRGKKIRAILGVGNKPADYSKKDVEATSLLADLAWEIAERKQVEQQVALMSFALNGVHEAAFMLDENARFQYVNDEACRILEYSRDELLTMYVPDINPDFPPERWSGHWADLKKHGALTFEGHFKTREGRIFPVEINANYFEYMGQSFDLGLARDVTERKKLEAQLRQSQKMEAVGQLAGGVAHDFNNMLGVIIGRAEMALEKGALNDSLRKNLEEILAAGLRSTEITRQLLAFARKQTITPRILDLNQTIEGMHKLLRRLIGEDIDLAWLPETNLWTVKMDPSQIDQILANLCINARDAISGVGKVTIETRNTGFDDVYCAEHKGFSPGEYVMVAVSDNGSGMDKQTLDKIFEPFFTTKGLGKGTGLGLATIYGIVKQNAGFINVYSEPKHGSIFKIYLPRSADEAEYIRKESPVAPTARGKEAILLVEDESTVLNMVKQMLEEFGYEVLTSSTPGEAMRIASENSGEINLLITDVVMPEMTGRDLAKNLNSLYPELKCLYMSGYTGNVIAQHGVLDKGVNFIQKPFSMQELAAKVREVLDSK